MQNAMKLAGSVAMVVLVSILVAAALEAARRRGIDPVTRIADVLSPREAA